MYTIQPDNTIPMRGKRRYGALLPALLLVLLSLTGCDGMGVYDDLEECPRGVVMRFVFDYNLEYANAFPNQVDCLSVYLFDSEGNLVERRTENTGVLADEDWRMTFDLPAGDYQVVAYGGLECDMASFAHTREAEQIQRIEDLEVLINPEYIGNPQERPAHKLHDLYHGLHSFTVHEGTDYEKTTVPMMRDTNNIRIVLQHLDYTPVDDKDFNFEIVDDNVLFDYDNSVMPYRTVTYTPWITGTAKAGLNLTAGAPAAQVGRIGAHEVQVAYADFSVSRLMHKSAFLWEGDNGKTQYGPRLRITTRATGSVVADLPLINYLLLLKGENLREMDSQEYLDRANNYSLVFFLDRNLAWVRMHIIVENWTVRVDNIEM